MGIWKTGFTGLLWGGAFRSKSFGIRENGEVENISASSELGMVGEADSEMFLGDSE